ncbi:unnamed protein product [Echinostoma caproni]|uniref:Secreted protein n=1 Tax=Echinostoma caproni TaxID=27848 RepID=A0A183AXM3_9TREM|nr:unnamed protein product [Echinostoma caproni]
MHLFDAEKLTFSLLLYSGFISNSSPGVFALWPNFMRTFDKLSALVNRKMACVGAHRLLLPTLGNRNIWEASGRWKTEDGQLFLLKDRCEKEFCLQPVSTIDFNLLNSLESRFVMIRLMKRKLQRWFEFLVCPTSSYHCWFIK